jgi:hypothetical protein
LKKKLIKFEVYIDEDGQSDSLVTWDLKTKTPEEKIEVIRNFGKILAGLQCQKLLQKIRFDISKFGTLSNDRDFSILLVDTTDKNIANYLHEQINNFAQETKNGDEPIFDALHAFTGVPNE